jgi:hypothetical protein
MNTSSMAISSVGDTRFLMGASQWQDELQLVDKVIDSRSIARQPTGDTTFLLHASQ